MAFVAKDTLEALKVLEESIDDKNNLVKCIKNIATYEVMRRIAVKTMGKKRLRRILKIAQKYVDKKIITPIEKKINNN